MAGEPIVIVKNQSEADARLPWALANGPVHLRIEGMEGKIDLPLFDTMIVDLAAEARGGPGGKRPNRILSVTVSGGEGPLHPDHVRSIRDQCKSAEVPFRFLGWGEWGPSGTPGKHRRILMGSDGRWASWNPPPGIGRHGREGLVTLYRVGRGRSGRTLDGREWNGEQEC